MATRLIILFAVWLAVMAFALFGAYTGRTVWLVGGIAAGVPIAAMISRTWKR